MNFRYTTAGESHGPELLAIIEGVPSGIRLTAEAINRDLSRRQLGYGRGGRMKIESDQVKIASGVRHERTLGTPIGLRIENADWQNWQGVMGAGPAGGGENDDRVTVPRPGHADLAGVQKHGFKDIRDVLERASARETASRVAAGAVARQILSEFGAVVYSHVVRIGSTSSAARPDLSAEDFAEVDHSPVRCLEKKAAAAMIKEIDTAGENGESVGGVFEVIVFGLVPGLGSYASGPERLGGRIGGALMSIPAIKGVEIGDGFALAGKPGSQAHDEIYFKAGEGYYRKTNAAGGLEGGMTTGQPLIARACMKPIPTLTNPLRSVDISSGEEVPAHKERSDVCAVPAAAVVGEAMVAIVLAKAMLEKFGGDSIADTKESYLGYLRRLRGSWPKQ